MMQEYESVVSRPEQYRGQRRIIPVLAAHKDVINTWHDERAMELFGERREVLPDLHFWPESAIKRVKALKPRILGIDSLGDPRTDPFVNARNYLFYLSPGNPFDLRVQNRDIFILGGDIATFDKDKDSEFIVGRFPLTGKIVAAYLEQLLEGPSPYEPKSDNFLDGLKESVAIKAIPEFAALAIVAVLAEDNLRNATMAALTLDAVRVGLHSRLVRSELFEKVPYRRLVRLTKPLFERDAYDDLRNALVAMKLDYAQSLLSPKEIADGPTVALFGTAHGIGKNLWNNTHKREAVLGKAVGQVLRNLDKSYSRRGESVDHSLRERIIGELSLFFGAGTIWRVKEGTGTNRVEEIRQQMPKEREFVTPAIVQIVHQVACKVWS